MKRFIRLIPLLAVAIGLPACEARHYEVVEKACIEDGNKTDYCRCMRRELKQELGFKDFAVFSDLVLLGKSEQIKPSEVLRLMEKHRLTPANLAEIREAIDRAGPLAEQRCPQ